MLVDHKDEVARRSGRETGLPPGPLVAPVARGAPEATPTPRPVRQRDPVTVPTRDEAAAGALARQRAGERAPAPTPGPTIPAPDPITVPTRDEAAASAMAAQRAGERRPPTTEPDPIPTPPALGATRPAGIATRELNLPTLPPQATPPQERPGPVAQLWEAYRPDFLTVGATFGENYPAKGAVLLSMPYGNGPLDFTTGDGTAANSIVAN